MKYLTSQPTVGRLEIPFTSAHWEAAYVAPRVPLARGWLRQLDTLDNPIFYASAPINATSYHQWLIESGVTWVALPDVSLDYSAAAEARLLEHGQPYLQLAWNNAHWRLWKVTDSPGLVNGPAHVVALGPDHVTLEATGTGPALVRVRYTSLWHIARGSACLRSNSGRWTELLIQRPGRIELTTSLFDTSNDCTPAPSERAQLIRHRTAPTADTLTTPQSKLVPRRP